MSVPSPTKIPDASLVRLVACAAVLATVLGSGGCAVQRPAELPPMGDWELRRAALSDIDEWEFRGRIAVKAGEDGFNGNLDWWQKGDLFAASVGGPFGAGKVRIQGDERFMKITDADGETQELADAERELALRYGWTIPVASLRYWALGIPDPTAPANAEFGDDGLLRQLEQRQWTVSIDEYRDNGGQPMPRRITAENADTRVRLVIDRWEFR